MLRYALMKLLMKIFILIFILAIAPGCMFVKKVKCRKLSSEHAQLLVGKNPYAPKGKDYKKFRKKSRSNECAFRMKKK